MLWHKPFILLGILATASIAVPAPLTLVEDDLDLTPPVNYTDFYNGFVSDIHSLDKRAKKKPKKPQATGVTYVWRADTRRLRDIIASDGFRPKGELMGSYEMSLFKHCNGKIVNGLGTGIDNDGYISTSSSFDFVERWLVKELKGNGMIFKIAAYPNLIDVEATLLQHSPYPHEKEFAAIHSITFDQIRGWFRYTKTSKGLVKGHYEHNTQYNKNKYDGKPHGGAQYTLAGFPSSHKAWSQEPWIFYSYCKAHKRDVLVRDGFLETPSSGAALFARARGGRGGGRARPRPARPSRKKAPRRKKAKTPKTKKAKTPKTKKTKAKTPKAKTPKTKKGKAKSTCTPEMKKKGKCKDQKKNKCGPAKTSNQAYNEYVRLLKAGKPPAPGAAPAGGRKGASKKKGGRTRA